jgi:hypothetical protein
MKKTGALTKMGSKIRRTFLMLLTGFAVAFSGMTIAPKKAEACCSCSLSIVETSAEEWAETLIEFYIYLETQFTLYRLFLVEIFWEDNILPAMMAMAQQLTGVAMMQVEIFGQFLDAKHQMETQQVLQTMQARIHKDYHPSVGMCEFGSTVKSLAASDRKADYTALLLSERSQDRNLGNAYSSGALGEISDKESRLDQFRNKFCDPADNNNGLRFICDRDQDMSTGGIGATEQDRKNKDIDFVRTVEYPWSLDLDFTDTTLTDNEEEVMALASNLYGHDILWSPPAADMESISGADLTGMQNLYMDVRSVVAKRSVAENSFNAITSMKAAGTPGSREFMQSVLLELGVDPLVAAGMLGECTNPGGAGGTCVDPSYYAQMEVLTKKIFQNPDFYTNLYDKPANVDRKGVALQAIGLMQKFDLFKSYLRNEASLSVLLELAVMDLQDEVENEFNRQKGGAKPATR